jgi:general secretion pathway protein G
MNSILRSNPTPLQSLLTRNRAAKSLSAERGFTLVELLVVIVVLAILIGLLLPAVGGARRRGRIVQVQTEIRAIEAAIVGCKTTLGTEPPGALTLHATLAGWNGDPTSKGFISQIWPQFNFSSCGGASDGTNFLGSTDTIRTMNGAECLVFFLGGVRSAANQPLVGFSKNPLTPFAVDSGSRTGPFYNFTPARLVDKDADNMPEFVDPLPSQTSPYLYFSANNGRKYTFRAGTGSNWSSADNWDDVNVGAEMTNWGLGRWMKQQYFDTFDSTSATGAERIRNSVPALAQKYQIISPGFDGVNASDPLSAYGLGGLVKPDADTLPPRPTSFQYNPAQDNITNFHSGTLGNL